MATGSKRDPTNSRVTGPEADSGIASNVHSIILNTTAVELGECEEKELQKAMGLGHSPKIAFPFVTGLMGCRSDSGGQFLCSCTAPLGHSLQL